MKPNNSSWLKFIFSPYTLGTLITLGYVLLSLIYYQSTHLKTGQVIDNILIKYLQMAHQKSIDFRLQQRGLKPPSPEVALLAVDEASVLTLGRWPWSREIIAQTINKAAELGAKVIAFDAVFSEPSVNSATHIFNRLKQDEALPPLIVHRFKEALDHADPDRQLKESIQKNSSLVVLGSFFDSRQNDLMRTTYNNRCFNYIYENSPAYQIWNNEESFLGIVDPREMYIPETLVDLYKNHLQTLEKEMMQTFSPPKNRHEELEAHEKIKEALFHYCENWLNPQSDPLFSTLRENWSKIVENEDKKTFSFGSFEHFVRSFTSQYPRNLVPAVSNWVMNTPEISSGVKQTGYFNAQLDDDGSIRTSQLVVRNGEHYFPSLALKSFLVAKNYNAQIELEEDAKYQAKVIKQLTVTDNENGQPVFNVPVDAQGGLMINYAGPQNMFPYLGVSELLSPKPTAKISQNIWDEKNHQWIRGQIKEVNKAEWVKNKIFIFGATAVGIYDLRVTPFDENFPGAETHLNVIDNLLRQNFLRHHPDEDLRMPVFLLLIGLFLTFIISRLGALMALLVTTSMIILIAVIDKYYLFSPGYLVTIIHPFILVFSLYLCLTFYKYFSEEKNKRELRSTFQKYVSPAIVEEILSDPEKIELGGRKATMTVFFSDVRGFTTISEKLDPHALSDFLNSYLTPMTEIIFKNKGTLDKYMGDAIMAFFGAPIFYPEHAKYACLTALEHLDKLKELQTQYKKQGLPPIDIGIGLNTGEMSVGNMGSETVRNYTVMGDSVNLGSRLEGINKQYGTRIIISESTFNEVKNDFICREIDWVRVKGKFLPVKIYELLAKQILSPDIQEMLKWFNEGYQKYHQKEWAIAKEHFQKALSIIPEDSVSKLYLERCEEFMLEPPSSNWDGVFIMKSK